MPDEVHRHAKLVGDDLAHLGVDALTHLDPAVRHRDCPVLRIRLM